MIGRVIEIAEDGRHLSITLCFQGRKLEEGRKNPEQYALL